MKPGDPRTTEHHVFSDMQRKRGESRRRWIESACYILLGILLYYGYHLFKTFEGPVAAVGPLPHDHPMHRVIEAAVFLAVAVAPIMVYLILQFWSRRRDKRTRD